MKLKENKYKNKEGVEIVTYAIGKLNEYGEGLPVDTKLDFKLTFPPSIRVVEFVNGKGEKKSFVSVNILAQCSQVIDNVKYHPQFNNAYFGLSEKYAEWVKDCVPGDVVTVWLRSFEVIDKETQKPVRKSTWDCNINSVNVKSGSKLQSKIEDDEVVKEQATCASSEDV
jgi:hypothetical protein